MIEELKKEREALQTRIRDINEYLQAHCKMFGHDWRDDGHDSHYSYNKCFTCEKVEKV
jgi:hypothetical protein